MSQTEAENIRTGSYGHVLLTGKAECHRRGLHANVSGKLPKCLAVTLVYGREPPVWLPIEDQSSCRGQYARPGFSASRTRLGNFPDDGACFYVDGAQEALTCFVRVAGWFTRAFLDSP